MSVRESFVARFGEDEACRIEMAALSHAVRWRWCATNKGSDPFRWAIIICIRFQCFVIGEYRELHGITSDIPELKDWIRTECQIGAHDGDIDVLAAYAGMYDEYLPNPTASEPPASPPADTPALR